jgi:hypothetical protein
MEFEMGNFNGNNTVSTNELKPIQNGLVTITWIDATGTQKWLDVNQVKPIAADADLFDAIATPPLPWLYIGAAAVLGIVIGHYLWKK